MQIAATARLIRAADLAGTFVFAIGGAQAAMAAHLDPIGVLVIAFVAALGGGMLRDMLIGATPVAALADATYAVIVLAAAALAWIGHAIVPPFWLLATLDALGLGLFAVAGTEKALSRGIAGLPAIFLGMLSATGGGMLRDVLLREVPRILYVDIYATAALAAAIIVVLGRRMAAPPRLVAGVAALACIVLRLAAVHQGWHLPRG